jgi:hypothetical protein
MASSARHPFFLLTLKWGMEKIKKTGFNIFPEAITGPVALRENIAEFEKPKYHGEALNEQLEDKLYPPEMTRIDENAATQAIVLPFWYIYPYSHERDGAAFRPYCWASQPTFNATRCKELVAVDRWPSYTITYWSHTWTENGHDDNNVKNVS